MANPQDDEQGLDSCSHVGITCAESSGISLDLINFSPSRSCHVPYPVAFSSVKNFLTDHIDLQLLALFKFLTGFVFGISGTLAFPAKSRSHQIPGEFSRESLTVFQENGVASGGPESSNGSSGEWREENHGEISVLGEDLCRKRHARELA